MANVAKPEDLQAYALSLKDYGQCAPQKLYKSDSDGRKYELDPAYRREFIEIAKNRWEDLYNIALSRQGISVPDL